jgi:hypothetical protein
MVTAIDPMGVEADPESARAGVADQTEAGTTNANWRRIDDARFIAAG